MKLGRLTLTARLTALFTLASAVLLLGSGLLVARAVEQHFGELDRTYLDSKARLLERLVIEAPDLDFLLRQTAEIQGSHPDLVLRLRIGEQVLFATPGAVFPPPSQTRAAPAGMRQWRDGGRLLRGIRVPLQATNMHSRVDALHQPAVVDLAMDQMHHTHFMSDFLLTLIVYLLLGVVASGLLGWWAVHRGLTPLRIMRQRARQVTAQRLDARMPIDAVPAEMADLARSLNAMLDRLEDDFRRLMQFADDLAHELRTPISNLMTQTEVSLSQPRDATAYREVLASNVEEFQRLARTISDMLYLAKTASEVELPHAEPIALDTQVQALFDFYDAVAEEKGLRLALAGDGTVHGDKLMLRRAIGNLLSNAVRHAAPDTTIAVRIEDSPQTLRLCVENEGDTIAAAHLARLFDRFYRVDSARHHTDADGTGLGLSITRAIMTAHGGTVSVSSQDRRTVFCLEFPAHGLPPES